MEVWSDKRVDMQPRPFLQDQDQEPRAITLGDTDKRCKCLFIGTPYSTLRRTANTIIARWRST